MVKSSSILMTVVVAVVVAAVAGLGGMYFEAHNLGGAQILFSKPSYGDTVPESGTVTANSGSSITVQTVDGTPYTFDVGPGTRFVKNQQVPVTAKDAPVGSHIFISPGTGANRLVQILPSITQ